MRWKPQQSIDTKNRSYCYSTVLNIIYFPKTHLYEIQPRRIKDDCHAMRLLVRLSGRRSPSTCQSLDQGCGKMMYQMCDAYVSAPIIPRIITLRVVTVLHVQLSLSFIPVHDKQTSTYTPSQGNDSHLSHWPHRASILAYSPNYKVLLHSPFVLNCNSTSPQHRYLTVHKENVFLAYL